ncbi:hypothetical protein HBH64_148040 [Parastagonospora nodorum]|nr:hypothetical protein HBI01_023390 [Parastagonospora nodorum]KAH4315623.1 hypothetical protein HBI02_056840 [Parastagonospora nodorum]KAH4338134.1 hypothetical protein HBI00_000300 [Parastagonospora nodorum]KAH4386794.1 hypothetical protein HBH94_045340 [Parastagonospora nodorum]KAH4471248.1 hypothetical protein HBH90_066210 [Parastagonospora nodorum]
MYNQRVSCFDEIASFMCFNCHRLHRCDCTVAYNVEDVLRVGIRSAQVMYELHRNQFVTLARIHHLRYKPSKNVPRRK